MRHIAVLIIVFVLLIGVNLNIAYQVVAKTRQAEQSNKLLDEIASAGNSSDQLQQFGTTAPLVMNTSSVTAEVITGDGRVANLHAFFRKYDSPLFDQAEYIIKISDKYGMDYRLIPAISMQESGACRVIPDNSYNCWGWGIYGTTITRFSSYQEAIETVARGLKKNYIDKGLITASMIMSKYNPSSNGSWAFGVNHFLDRIEQ
ncbi:MAG: hypothetical protein WCO06_06190 [Candidatus Roizmanbacteria bacterium]